MKDKSRLVEDLLLSLSGILLFISLAYFIDLNGYSSYAPVLILFGVTMLFWPEPFLHFLSPIKFIHKPIILSVSHILIFIGAKTYLGEHIANYCIVFFVLGIVLLNYGKVIARKIMNG